MTSARERPSAERNERAERKAPERDAAPHAADVPTARELVLDGLGNRALLSLLRSGQLQRKARLSQDGDPREHAADRAAESVVSGRLPAPIEGGQAIAADVQRMPAAGQGLALAVRPGPIGGAARPTEPRSVRGTDLASGLAGGRPLDEHTRAFMESRFGESFDAVRIHTGPRAGETADALHSRAFTVGSDVVFSEGEYAPETTAGRRLLAHELAHVVQQRRPSGPIADETQTERDAHEAAHEVTSGGTGRVRERARNRVVQKAPLKELSADYSAEGWPRNQGGISVINWIIAADFHDVVRAFDAPYDTPPKPRAWENTNTNTVYVDPGTAGSSQVIRKGRWDQVRITRGEPQFEPPVAPAPKSPPKAAPAPQKPKPDQKKAPPAPSPSTPVPQVVPEVVIGPDEDIAEPVTAPPEADRRPVKEQVVSSLTDDPANAARLAPQLTDSELEQLTAKDRIDLLNALAANAGQGLDIQTVLRVLQTTALSQQNSLLDGLVANDGKVLTGLRAAVRPEDRNSLENGLIMLQLAVDLRAGHIGAGPNLFDPLGARGFRPIVKLGGNLDWMRDLQFRTEPNGDWTLQAPGEKPLIIEGPLTRALRAERRNEQIASYEARQLSAQGKVDRIKELAEHNWTGSGDEERIIDILRYTSPGEAAQVLNGLKTTQSGDKALIDKLDDVTDLENNVLLHAQIAALRLRARRDDPKLLTDLAKAPVLPWRDAFFHNRAVFTLRTLPDGRIAVTYGALQSFELEASDTFGAAMRGLPKEMQHGGTLFLQPDDLVIVNDTDGNRQVPLTAADLIAFQHSGNRGMLKHMGNVASVAIPVGLAARGTYTIGRAAVEAGGALLLMTADEYRMELTKWSPGLMRAIDIANVAMAIKGGVDLTKLGAAGMSAIYSGLKKEYGAFQAIRAGKIAASGDAQAIRAAQIADAEAQGLLREMEQLQKGPGIAVLEELDEGAAASAAPGTQRNLPVLDASDLDPDLGSVLGRAPCAQGNCFRNAVVMGARFEGFEGAIIKDVPHVRGEGTAVGGLFEKAWGAEARFQPGGLDDAARFASAEGAGSQVILRVRNKKGALHALLGRVNKTGTFEVWDAKLHGVTMPDGNEWNMIVRQPANLANFEILGFRKIRFR